jgi:hypothetical protein
MSGRYFSMVIYGIDIMLAGNRFGQGYLLYARVGNPEEGTALADFKSFVENNFRNAKCEEEHAGAVRYAVRPMIMV